MNVAELKIEERYVRLRLKEVRRLIQKRNRGWRPPERTKQTNEANP